VYGPRGNARWTTAKYLLRDGDATYCSERLDERTRSLFATHTRAHVHAHTVTHAHIHTHTHTHTNTRGNVGGRYSAVTGTADTTLLSHTTDAVGGTRHAASPPLPPPPFPPAPSTCVRCAAARRSFHFRARVRRRRISAARAKQKKTTPIFSIPYAV